MLDFLATCTSVGSMAVLIIDYFFIKINYNIIYTQLAVANGEEESGSDITKSLERTLDSLVRDIKT